MSTSERMTVNERLKYLRVMKHQYLEADRAGKTQLLNEMQRATRYERKHLIRLLNGSLERPLSGTGCCLPCLPFSPRASREASLQRSRWRLREGSKKKLSPYRDLVVSRAAYTMMYVVSRTHFDLRGSSE